MAESILRTQRSTSAATARGPFALAREEGLRFERFFTRPDVHPYDEVEWEVRDAAIKNWRDGSVSFEQKGVEFPASWSLNATSIVAQKYFRGRLGSPERERSVRQMIDRVADTITRWGREGSYFADPESEATFNAELKHLLVQQKGSFNSPVWFNVGAEPAPQCSACFILAVEDTIPSILNWYAEEGIIFKGGSGSGVNLSTLRSSREHVKAGGHASGPVSFMRGADASAGTIKSGGRTRRAAKMVVLNVDHPDVEDFIWTKAREERKARALREAGFDMDLDGKDSYSLQYQNANNSVRVTDDFMGAYETGRDHPLKAVTTGETLERKSARDLMRQIAQAAWECADPGMQYDTTINDWHTCPASGRINASNPCVTGDTLVATAEGWQRIAALVGRTARIVGADGQPHFVTRIFPTGRKQVFRLQTRAGLELRLTGDHKVLTERGDVAAVDLRVGDRIQLQGPGFGRRALSERLALAIGVAVGDGCLTRTVHAGGVQEIVILSMAADEAGVLARIAGEINEQKARLVAAGGDGRNRLPVAVRTTSSSSRLAFSSREAVACFKEFSILDEGSTRKRFSPAVFELDRPSLAAVLRGLFTADGTVADYGDKSQYVSLDSSSLELLRQVQMLLLGFGIKAKIYTDRRGAARTSMLPDGQGGLRPYPVAELHSLRISRSSRLIFEREIGFDAASPKAAVLAALNARMGAYRDELSDPVASVEALGEEDVFDLTEPVTSHFVANGLVVHNCSEYMHLDNSACNLASLNLKKFYDYGADRFDIEAFTRAVEILFTAQEIIVGFSAYPTEKIRQNAVDYRELGLGYANLGGLLMSLGLPYDSDAGRAWAAALTALMCGHAYRTSAELAAVKGPFAGYPPNRDGMLRVVQKHRAAVADIEEKLVPREVFEAARRAWDEALELGAQVGYRNSQATVLAPTGTIGLMMDCDTTGIEPDLALVKTKKLVGGGSMSIVNRTVPQALQRLGYGPEETDVIVAYVDEHKTILGAPGLREEDLPVFSCAMGDNAIHYMGHVRMMAAVQPFLSGAISKTVNMPEEVTVEDVERLYYDAWKMGLKAIALYRDNCKVAQPLSISKKKDGRAAEKTVVEPLAARGMVRRKLPKARPSQTISFRVGDAKGYLTAGEYPEDGLGEIFVKLGKQGSTLSGLIDAFAISVSLGLQYGVPLSAYVSKFMNMRFDPAGMTDDEEIRFAHSIIDYLARKLAIEYLPVGERRDLGILTMAERKAALEGNGHEPGEADLLQAPAAVAMAGSVAAPTDADAPLCFSCGIKMKRAGGCHVCESCGSTSGCS